MTIKDKQLMSCVKSARQILGLKKQFPLPVLEQGLIQHDKLVLSNLETTLVISHNLGLGLEDRLVDLETSLKLGILFQGKTTSDNYPDLNLGLNCYLTSIIDISILTNALKYASKDKTKFNLCGLCFDTEQNYLVATDGHRIIRSNLNSEVKEIAKYIVSYEAIKLLLAVAKTLACQDIFYTIENGYFIVSDPANIFRLSSRLIDAEYPNYSVFFKEQKSFSLLNGSKEPMLKVCDRSIKLQGKKPSPDAIILQNDSISYQHLDTGIKIKESYHPMDFPAKKIGLNPVFLKEALGHCDSASFPNNSLEPVHFANKDNTETVILMPMRL